MLSMHIQANVKIVVQKKKSTMQQDVLKVCLHKVTVVLPTLLDYTKYWIGKGNRGGLFTVTDETLMFN